MVVDEFSTLPPSRYRYAVPMQAINQKGAAPVQIFRQQVIVNFCHTVLRSNDDLLKQAMSQYQQSLSPQQR